MNDTPIPLLRFSVSNSMRKAQYKRCGATWEEFVERLNISEPTGQKDCGNIVGGVFRADYRLMENLESRSMLTLDADYARADFVLEAMALDCAFVVYSTWRHTAEAPRLRLFAPLSREVSLHEYWLIAHAVMVDLGVEQFDQGSAEAERLMHLPSKKGLDYVSADVPGEALDADKWLARAGELDIHGRDDKSVVGGTSAPYDGPTYAGLSEALQRWSDEATEGLLKGWGLLLGEAAGWPDQYRDGHGRGWEVLARDFAWALARTAACPWASMTVEEAGDRFVELLPEDMAGALDSSDNVLADKWCQAVIDKAAKSPAEAPPWDGFEVEEALQSEHQHLAGRVTAALTGDSATKSVRLDSPDLDAVADWMIAKFWSNEEGCKVLHHWRGSTYEWYGTHWEKVPPKHLHGIVKVELADARWKKDKTWVRWPLYPKRVNDLVTMIELSTIIHAKRGSGHWIDCTSGRCPVGEHGKRYISFANGILDMDTLVLGEHDRAFFNTYSLHFDYDPAAVCPTWEASLVEWFPDRLDEDGELIELGQESRDALEEVMAYLLLGGIELDKIFAWLGKPRAGKGTIMRLVKAMLGTGFSTQALDDLGDRFALEDLLGVEVCHISEAVATTNNKKVVSLLKAISGRDGGMTVKTKGGKSIEGVDLSAKFVMTGNEKLTLLDESGVIADRLHVLDFPVSFLGKEDRGLEAALASELPGIFNRILTAHERLLERKRLLQPKSGEVVRERLRAKASPGQGWFREHFETTEKPGDLVPLAAAVESYVGRFQVTPRQAAYEIQELLPSGVVVRKVYVGGKQMRCVIGVRIRDTESEEESEQN